MILPEQVNLAEIAYLQHKSNEEKEIQARIVKARDMDAGDFNKSLASQTAKYLIGGSADEVEGVNLMSIVLRTVLRRIDVKGIATTDNDLTTWLEQIWDENGMPIKQADVHRLAERDGEAFVIVDYDPDAERPWEPDGARGMPTFYIHERFTSAEVGGSGEGCRAFYRNDDYNQPLEMVSRRWTETLWKNNKPETRQRMTLYIAKQKQMAARIEKYVYISGGWEPYTETVVNQDGQVVKESWPIWLTENALPTGRSLPLPVIHFRNEEIEPLTRRLWGVQNGMDHAWSALLGGLTQTAFRTLFVLGFFPTLDGKPPADDGSNLLPVQPGTILGTAEKGADKASVTVIDPADLSPVLETMDKMAIYCAFVGGLPIGNFIVSRQVVSSSTLQQGESDLLAHINALILLWGASWSRTLSVARRLDNLYGGASHNESAKIEALFAPPEVADASGHAEEAKAQAETGVPEEYIWRNVWGFSEEQVQEMKRIIAATPAASPVQE